jgi:hypothetical protein
LYRELDQAGCRRRGELAIPGSTWELSDGTLLRILESNEQWAREAMEQPNINAFGLPVIALPYLVVMKLKSGRVQDLADITRMLGGADDAALQAVRSAVQFYVPDAVEDIESMIALGRMELGDRGVVPSDA